jgi:hypothetical protein
MTKTGILQPAKPEALIFDIANSHVSRRWGPAPCELSHLYGGKNGGWVDLTDRTG